MKGQGAFEYLILVAAIISFVLIAFIILRTGPLSSANTQLTQLGGVYGSVVNAEMALGINRSAVLSLGNVSAYNITNNGATINWLTSQSANATVEYGLASNTYTLSSNDPTLNSNHTILLTSLLGSTLYFAKATSCNTTGDCRSSPEFNFTTLANPPAPSIYNLTVNATTSNATIYWDTDSASNTSVSIGTSPGAYSATASDPALLTAHSVFLSPLSANTTFYFIATSCHTYGCNATSEANFTTTAIPNAFNSSDFNMSLSLLQTNTLTTDQYIPDTFAPYVLLGFQFFFTEYRLTPNVTAPDNNTIANG